MITLLSLVALGFVLGMRHATDADHVVAVTTIVSRERSVRKAALVGVFWGIGHSFTVVVVGGAIVVFGLVVPERLGLSLEFTVALMLIGLGAWNLKPFFCAAGFWSESNEPVGDRRYFRETTAHDRASYHGHHRHESPSATPGNTPLQRMARPLCIGVVHGLAGSAAVALMVLPLIRNPMWAASYLLIFGLGTIAGMMFITAAIALPFKWTAAKSAAFHHRLGQLAAAGSVAFGLFLVYDIGFVQGLFKG